MLEAATDLTILTPREWQAVHGLKIDALRAALAEQPAEQESVARESVDDALMIVASYGPWGADLNDAHRRQIVLADEVHRLRHLYEMAVHGRAEMRAALRQERSPLHGAGESCGRWQSHAACPATAGGLGA